MSAPVMRTTNTFADVVNASVRSIFDVSSEDINSQIDGMELFTEYSPDAPAEQLSAIAGAGYGTLTIEGQAYGSNQLWRDYPTTLTLRKYSSELAWTEEDVHWLEKANQQKREFRVNSIASNGLRPLVGNINRDVAKMFYLGFGTTFFTGGDAVALFSGSHPIRASGGTQSNMFPTTHLPFSAANLVTAINIMNRFQQPNAVQARKVRRFRVVCSVELEPTVQQALLSMYGPSNANLGLQTGSKYAFSERGVDAGYIVLPEIPAAYTNYWFVVDLDRAVDRAKLAFAWKPRMVHDTRTQNGTSAIDSSTLFGPVMEGWQHVFGSIGNNAAV